MEIKDFVKNTLRQIVEAAQEATDIDDEFFLDTKRGEGVEFDLAVSYSANEKKTSKKDGGFRIKVVEAGINSAGEEKKSTERVSRIQFNIMHVDHAKKIRDAARL